MGVLQPTTHSPLLLCPLTSVFSCSLTWHSWSRVLLSSSLALHPHIYNSSLLNSDEVWHGARYHYLAGSESGEISPASLSCRFLQPTDQTSLNLKPKMPNKIPVCSASNGRELVFSADGSHENDICGFPFPRNNFNISSCAPIWSKHRVHLFLPAAPGQQSRCTNTLISQLNTN